jgi:hypothetical protein
MDNVIFGTKVEDADGDYEVRVIRGYSTIIEIKFGNGPVLVAFYLCPDTAKKLSDALKDAANAVED